MSAHDPNKKNNAPESKTWILGQNQLVLLLLCSVGLVTLLIGLTLAWFHSLPDIRTIFDYRPQEAILLLDRHYRPLDTIGREFRLVIPYTAMPPLLPKAFIAAEDSRFGEHRGLDPWSILQAAINTLHSDHESQSRSTITQQVTRALLLNREKSYFRKIAEAVLTQRLEHLLSKEDILSIYLNEIYLGDGAYGVEAASLVYFGKRASLLNLAEIAILAGLPQSPAKYSPNKEPQAAKERQRYILNRMAEDGIISEEEARAAHEQKIELASSWRQEQNGYFAQYIHTELLKHYSEQELAHLGLSVVTTLDQELQTAAVMVARAGAARVAMRNSPNPHPQVALVAMESHNGRIRAMVGGLDFRRTQYNRAVQGQRQPGSAFKPIIYAAALEQGIPAASTIEDTPLQLSAGYGDDKSWQPANFDHSYHQALSLTEALVRSSNVGTIRLLRKTGLHAVITLSQKMGITSPLQENLTLALGSSPVSLLELTGTYTAFASQGTYQAPVGITSLRSRNGQILPWPQPSAQRVFSRQTADWVHQVLAQVVQRGTGMGAAGPLGASGKTGTTENYMDAWFIGSADNGLTVGVWLGHDQGRSLGQGETGGWAAGSIWRAFMLKVF